MRHWLNLWSLCGLVFAHAGLHAQTAAEHRVDVQARLSHERVSAGSEISVILVVEVQDGWHINSASPSDESQIETAVNAKLPEGFTISKINYPQGVMREFGFSDVPLDVYEGSVHILLELNVAGKVKPGTYTLPVSLYYQACNDNICLAPSSYDLRVALNVVPPGEVALPANQEMFKPYLKKRNNERRELPTKGRNE